MEKAGSFISSVLGKGEPEKVSPTVKAIYIYPIKACRGVSVPQACVCPTVVKAPGMDPLQIPLLLQKTHEKVDNISMWEWSGSAFDEGSVAANWFSMYLGKPSRLVRFDTVSEVRTTDADYARGYKTMFSDEFPFLVISQGSLDALNKQLKEPLSINRFRPNIFIESCEPFAEDLWRTLRINGFTFHGVKLCARCKVFFGQNLICEESLNPRGRTGQVIRVGDSVHVLKKLCSSAEAAA